MECHYNHACNPNNKPSGYFPKLDGLRGIAVLAVIGYHFGFDHMRGGFIGVDLFMVLSGYLITNTLLKSEGLSHNLSRFYQRRIQRLLPTALVLIAVVLVVGSVLFPKVLHQLLRMDSIFSVLYVANWHFIISGVSYFDTVAPPSPLRHLWSLAIEEQFYLLWPFLLFMTPERWRTLITSVLVLMSAIAMVYLFDSDDPFRAYYGTDTRALALLLGSFVAIVVNRKGSGLVFFNSIVYIIPRVFFDTALVIIVLSFTFLQADNPYMYRGGFFGIALVAAFLIWGIVHERTFLTSKILSSSFLRSCGLRSYSLYLWHWPIIVFVSQRSTGFERVELQILRITLIVITSEISYRYIEKYWRWKKISFKRVGVISSAFAFTIVLTAIYLTRNALPLPNYLKGGTYVTNYEVKQGEQTEGIFVRVIGDSVVESLRSGLVSASKDMNIQIEVIAIGGCGLMPGPTIGDDGMMFQPSLACPDRVKEAISKIDSSRKSDIIIWYSAWDAENRKVNGKELFIGENDSELISLLNSTAIGLLELGNVVVVVSTPERAMTSILNPEGPSKIAKKRYQNAIVNTITVGKDPYDKIVAVNMNEYICRNKSPCIDKSKTGSPFRPLDGIHFGDEEVENVARWLLRKSLIAQHGI